MKKLILYVLLLAALVSLSAHGQDVGVQHFERNYPSELSFTSTAVTSTVPILLPNGTASSPSLAWASDADGTGTGLYRPGANLLSVSINGTQTVQFGSGRLDIISDTPLFRIGASSDVVLTRDAAASLQLGGDDATGTAQTISAADSTGAGVAGASLTLSGGVGGTFGKQGNVIVDASSTFVSRNTSMSIIADSVVQYGQIVMPDASADGRFDINATNSTLAIGVLGGVGPSAQGTAYPVINSGLAYVVPQENAAVTRGHYMIVSATAGCVNDSATVTTDGLNIGLSLYSEPVTHVIVIDGCGGGGCINTTTGAITLDTDVAALGWAVGQPVVYWDSGGTAPTGLTTGNVYFLKTVSTTTVTISATYGGAAVVPSDQGNDSTQYLQRLPQAVIAIH